MRFIWHGTYNMKKVKAQLEYDIDTLMDEKKWYETELDEIKREYYKIGST